MFLVLREHQTVCAYRLALCSDSGRRKDVKQNIIAAVVLTLILTALPSPSHGQAQQADQADQVQASPNQADQGNQVQSSTPATNKGCLAVQSIGSHGFRNIMLGGIAGALLSKEQYKVVALTDYPANIGDKFHGNDLQTIQSSGAR